MQKNTTNDKKRITDLLPLLKDVFASIFSGKRKIIGKQKGVENLNLEEIQEILKEFSKYNYSLFIALSSLLIVTFLYLANISNAQLLSQRTKIILPILNSEVSLSVFFIVGPIIILFFYTIIVVRFVEHHHIIKAWQKSRFSGKDDISPYLSPAAFDFAYTERYRIIFRFLQSAVLSFLMPVTLLMFFAIYGKVQNLIFSIGHAAAIILWFLLFIWYKRNSYTVLEKKWRIYLKRFLWVCLGVTFSYFMVSYVYLIYRIDKRQYFDTINGNSTLIDKLLLSVWVRESNQIRDHDSRNEWPVRFNHFPSLLVDMGEGIQLPSIGQAADYYMVEKETPNDPVVPTNERSMSDMRYYNFPRLDVSGRSFYKAFFASASLPNANFSNSNLQDANFYQAYLNYAIFSGANLEGAYFGGAKLSNANFHDIRSLHNASFYGAIVQNADFTDADLSGANFSWTDLRGTRLLFSKNIQHANFEYAILSGEHFGGIPNIGRKIQNIDFSNANLQGADFSYLNMEGANFSNANLQGAVFTGTFLQGANFSNANLQGAIFGLPNDIDINNKGYPFYKEGVGPIYRMGAILEGVNFAGANLQGAEMYNANGFLGAILYNTNLLGAHIRPDKITLAVNSTWNSEQWDDFSKILNRDDFNNSINEAKEREKSIGDNQRKILDSRNSDNMLKKWGDQLNSISCSEEETCLFIAKSIFNIDLENFDDFSNKFYTTLLGVYDRWKDRMPDVINKLEQEQAINGKKSIRDKILSKINK